MNNSQNDITPISTKAIRQKRFLKDGLECLRLDIVNNYLNHKHISDYPEIQKALQESARLIEMLDIVVDNSVDDVPW